MQWWRERNKGQQYGLLALLFTFLMVNPVTGRILYLLVLPTGLDDIIFWPLVILGFSALTGGTLWQAFKGWGGRLGQATRRALPSGRRRR